MARDHLPAGATWRKSSYSGSGGMGGGDCVEMAWVADDQLVVRDSKAPHTGTLHFPRTALATWLRTLTA